MSFRLTLTSGLAVIMLAVAFGCRKNPEAQAPVQNATPAIEAPAAPTNSLPAATPVAAQPYPIVTPNGQADLAELSRQLRGWIVGHRRVPDSFEEFVTSANLHVPPPPPGKKYVIHKSTVVLENR